MPSTIAIAKNYLCFKLPFSEYSFSFPSVPFSWHTHTHTHSTAILSEANTDTTTISEESPLLPHHHHQQQQNNPQSLKEKYGTCTTILHYGTSSSVRLYTITSRDTTTTTTNKKQKKIHVIKTLRPTPSSTKQTLKSTLESLLSSTLYHPHLLHTIDIIPNSRGETCLVSEYCELGDLGTYISTSNGGSSGDSVMGVREADKILYQIMSAVEFLHEMGVVHGCVCVENIFLSHSYYSDGVCVKLGDLGDARVLDSQLSHDHDHVGVKGGDGGGDGYYAAWKEDVYPLVRGVSMGIGKFEELELEGRCDRRKRVNPYAAPEVLSPPSPSSHSSAYSSAYRRRGYETSSGIVGDDPRAVDIWAVGIIYLVLRLGRILWRSASEEEDGRYAEYLAGRKRREGYGVIEGLGGAQCRNVVYAMLNPDANRRIKASEVMRSEWMYNLDVHQ
ncbi:hypothetical protein ASPTUDRAFT_62009 [Aspergillus tubingensis CBS 134.48]|uniref:non-specific serine/threonine protein kinase n=1 Tax=Aspergillus tubingensis (strain CBS 134.48) TaxID=767770 RepID=A0A1L9NE83_ASPTC|nr:hypothetical protein ASPTUDRAFT_62009 [Aspergillus tubingensis CBS 134.48]